MTNPSNDDAARISAIAAKGMRSARNLAFDSAIELCEQMYLMGGCAKCCADAIREMRDRVDRDIGNAMIFEASEPHEVH